MLFNKRLNSNSLPTIQQYLLSIVVILSLSILTACGGGAASTAAGAESYIAHIDDAPPTARIGIVVENGKFAVYICSLDDAFNLAAARWYSGDVAADGSVQGTSPDGVQFQGKVGNGEFTGNITGVAGKVWTFKGALVPAGGPAGLYRGVANYGGQDIVVGAVIDPDGSFASTVQYKGQIAFVTPVNSAPLRVDNDTIKVTLGDPSQQVEVTLVTTLIGVELF